MLVFRWQAPIVPDKTQITALYEAEGLTPFEEVYSPETLVGDHRHPFDEVRTVVQGEVMFDIAGNKLLLRPGDRIVIPSNTRHSFKAQGNENCVCICANRVN
jgi:quercetin dioxygenase-like cupin family protein